MNDDYKEVASHERRYGIDTEPIVDWIKYLPAISRKPNSLKYTGFFKQLPVVWQEYFQSAGYTDSKTMLSVLTPIILDGKLEDATVAMELHDIRDADDFLIVYRNLTEPPKLPEIALDNVPIQSGKKYDLSVYAGFLGGNVNGKLKYTETRRWNCSYFRHEVHTISPITLYNPKITGRLLSESGACRE